MRVIVLEQGGPSEGGRCRVVLMVVLVVVLVVVPAVQQLQGPPGEVPREWQAA